MVGLLRVELDLVDGLLVSLQDGDGVCVAAEVPEGDGAVGGARGHDVGLRQTSLL